MVDVSPGMLDGDTYELDFTLERDAHLVLTNQSFTKIHPATHSESTLHAHFKLAEGSVLEYFPEPTIPYAGSRFHGVNRFDLTGNATLLYADVVTPGRTHRDEKFVFDRFANDLEVYRNGKLVVWDHFLLQPTIHQFDAIGAMEQFTHCGSFWIITEQPTVVLLEVIREVISKVDSSAVLAAASLTADKSISVRMLGHNVWQLQQLIQTIWDLSREHLLNLPACHLRK
jgi:urease accessory protein